MDTAFNWFLGNNHLHQIIYNPCTGGCYDGLEEDYFNLNQGAESTVSYLMARLTIEKSVKNNQKMKNMTFNFSKPNIPLKHVLVRGLALIMLFLVVSCSQKAAFLNSSVVPAARGYVKVKNDKNKNYSIQIHLSDLAEVERLQPPKQMYVIWMVTDQDITKNIGQINSSKGFMSKELKASFETVSSFKPTKIFITAEDDANIQYPGTQVVLSTDDFND
jgi:hypothetical protein